MNKQELPNSRRLLFLISLIAFFGATATYHLTALSETRSLPAATNPAAPRSRPTPEECVSDPDSIACLKARIDELETARRNQARFLNRLDGNDSSLVGRLRQVEEEFSELKRTIGKSTDEPESGETVQKNNFDNIWRSINTLRKRVEKLER